MDDERTNYEQRALNNRMRRQIEVLFCSYLVSTQKILRFVIFGLETREDCVFYFENVKSN